MQVIIATLTDNVLVLGQMQVLTHSLVFHSKIHFLSRDRSAYGVVVSIASVGRMNEYKIGIMREHGEVVYFTEDLSHSIYTLEEE